MEEKELSIVEDIDNDEDEYLCSDEDECPCDHCPNKGWCDEWDSRYCCAYCRWCGCDYCDNCDPMDN